jgi:hypothetical protein
MVMDMTTITAALTSVRAIKELLQAATRLKIDNETIVQINNALNEVAAMQEQLFEAREQLFNLQKENDELRQQIKAHDDWTTRLDAFLLNKTIGGAVVYESRTNKPKHYACPHCIERQQIQILQDLNLMSGDFKCPGCKNTYPIDEKQKIDIKGPGPQYF